MEGKKFKNWLVLYEVKTDKLQKRYRCECDCGNFDIKVGAELRRGRGTSCSNCKPKRKSNDTSEIGKQYGNWKVLEIAKVEQSTKNKFRYFKCLCKCGLIENVRADGLRNGKSIQCRACREKEFHINPYEFIGTKIGKLKILKEVENKKLLCECECGKQELKSASILKNKKSLKCHLCNVTKHGYENSPTYNTWRYMKARCNNIKNHNYSLYGGRGIKICDRWLDFKNFLEDMGERPENMELDRIDTNGNYEKSNCRWATKSENALNRRPRKKNDSTFT